MYETIEVRTDKEAVNSVLPGGRAKSLIISKANQMARKLESVPFTVENEKLKKILRKSRFNNIRTKLGRELSIKGRKALVIIPNKSNWFIDMLEIVDSKMFGNELLLVEGTTGSIYTHQNVSYPIHSKFYLSGGKAFLDRYIWINTKDSDDTIQMAITETVSLGINFIPAEIFENNVLGVSDVEYSNVSNDIARLNYLDVELLPEFERTRTMVHYNTSLSNIDPATDSKERDAGMRRYVAERGMAGKVGGSLTMIPANGGTAYLMQQILFLEADIKEKLGIIMQADGGNNKHILEIMVKDQNAIEMLEEHRALREEHYNNFFEKLCNILSIEEVEVELELSRMEIAKMEQLEATIVGEKAKAQNTNIQNKEQTNNNEGE